MALYINWFAVIIVGLLYFFIHFFWYYPNVFGNSWLKLVGKTGEPKSKIIRETIIMIPNSIVTVLILAILMSLTGMTDIFSAILLSLLVWIGFIAVVGINQSLFNNRGAKLFLIEYVIYLIDLMIAGTILAVWG